MSNKAYKVKRVDLSKDATFNVSDNFSWLESIAIYKMFNTDGECVGMEFEEVDIIKAINEEKDDDKKEVLNKILQDIKTGIFNAGFVTYDCH